MKQPDIDDLVNRFRSPEVKAIVLMGSFAREDAGRFSDVDLLRFVKEEAKDRPSAVSRVIDGRLVVVCDIAPNKIDSWFTRPEEATGIIVGLRDAQPVWDPDGYFEEIQRRAREFVWDSSMQEKADVYASREMVGWAEEAHKGLEGLRTNDAGRMLNAQFGLSWGLTTVVRVQRGVLLTTDNSFSSEVIAAVGEDSEWGKLCSTAFDIEGKLPLSEQVKAWLWLYVLTARMIENAIKPEDKDVIDHTVSLIQVELERR